LVTRRCLRLTSLGITRGFPRLYPITGLVTVALLTLAPLALRPVRLACLIHAANVHSEPGSNPSKVGPSRRPRGLRSSPPRTERVEESADWSHRGVLRRSPASEPPRCRFREPAPAVRTENHAVRRLLRPVAGSPQGFTSNILVHDRPDCQGTEPRPTPDGFGRGDLSPVRGKSLRPSRRLDSQSCRVRRESY
jgi:hypothetical protein